MAVETWILSSVCLLALGGVAIMNRKNTKDAKEELQGSVNNLAGNFDKLERRVKDDLDQLEEEKEGFLTRETHELMCENQALTINKHMTKELSTLKDETFSFLRDLNTKIDTALAKRRTTDDT